MNQITVHAFLDELEKHAGAAGLIKEGQAPQDEVFAKVKPLLPRGAQHASGGLPDAGRTSDVDVVVFRKNHNALLSSLPKGTTQKSKGNHTIYSIPGYDRKINLYATAQKGVGRGGFRTGLRHRSVELALETRFPRLAERAWKAKAGGLSTEVAWAQVLQLQGDPYEAMLDRRGVLRAARAQKKYIERTA